MERRGIAIVVAVALLAALGVFLFRPADPKRSAKRDDIVYEAPPIADLNARAAHDDAQVTAPSGFLGVPQLDRARADAMRAALRALYAEAGVPWGAADAPRDASRAPAAHPSMPTLPAAADAAPRIDPKYIQHIVHDEYLPLARQCYANAQAKNPRLAGRIELHFRIVGDESIGGVVDDARVADGSTIDDAELRTCIRESMMAVSFDAPPGGGSVTVKFPIDFSPEHDDAGD